ncbi:PREDICTED: monocarboxylate transporter 4 [Condylura cristata]|uniref:monocarboxylate transporter 4 n=1 Tax=Condylura cristata TaxID=143302 RepID=UPI0006432FFD|nr:PREDICTED: monocarboxylate transporter 4 [Condylura cristata]
MMGCTVSLSGVSLPGRPALTCPPIRALAQPGVGCPSPSPCTECSPPGRTPDTRLAATGLPGGPQPPSHRLRGQRILPHLGASSSLGGTPLPDLCAWPEAASGAFAHEQPQLWSSLDAPPSSRRAGGHGLPRAAPGKAGLEARTRPAGEAPLAAPNRAPSCGACWGRLSAGTRWGYWQPPEPGRGPAGWAGPDPGDPGRPGPAPAGPRGSVVVQPACGSRAGLGSHHRSVGSGHGLTASQDAARAPAVRPGTAAHEGPCRAPPAPPLLFCSLELLGDPRASFRPRGQRDSGPAPAMGGAVVDEGPAGVKAPDGGWGWAVLLGCFAVTGFSYAFPKAVSVFFKELMREFGIGYSDTAWVSSILLAMLYGTGQPPGLSTGRKAPSMR